MTDYGDPFPWSTVNRDAGNRVKLEADRSSCRVLETQMDFGGDFNESGGGNSYPSLEQAGFDAVSAAGNFTFQSLPVTRYPSQYYFCSKKRDNGVLRMKVANAVIDLTATPDKPMKKTNTRRSFDNSSRTKRKAIRKRKSSAENICNAGSLSKQKARLSVASSKAILNKSKSKSGDDCLPKEKGKLGLTKNDDADDTEKSTTCKDSSDHPDTGSTRSKRVKSRETVTDVQKSTKKIKPKELSDMVNITGLSKEVQVKNKIDNKMFSDPCTVEHSKTVQPVLGTHADTMDCSVNDEDHTGCDSDMDIEMLALACEELKTLPPSPLVNASSSTFESETFTDVPILTQACDQLKSSPLSPLSNSSDNTFSVTDAPSASVPHFNGTANAISTHNSIVKKTRGIPTAPNGFSDFDKMPPDKFRANSKLFSYSAFGVIQPKSSFRLSDRKKAQLKLIKAESSQTLFY